MSLIVLFFKKEDQVYVEDLSYREIMGKAYEFAKLPNVRMLILILLTSKFASSVNDSVVPLVFLEKGFPESDLALLVVCQLPLEIIISITVGLICRDGNELFYY